MDKILHAIDQCSGVVGKFPACFAFSIHKAGSTLMHEMIRDVSAAISISAISFPDKLYQQGILDHLWAHDPKLLKYIHDGRIYYGFRYFPAVLSDPVIQIRSRRSVLLVRDPRDILVSQYFSFGNPNGSHIIPPNIPKEIADTLKPTETIDIDGYVLNSAEHLLGKFASYKIHLLSGNMRMYQYEEIYYNKQLFLQGIFDHFKIEVPGALVKQVALNHDIRPVAEDPTKHIRQGAPGDHRRKLRPGTIAQLNEQFRDIGRDFGYALNN